MTQQILSGKCYWLSYDYLKMVAQIVLIIIETDLGINERGKYKSNGDM